MNQDSNLGKRKYEDEVVTLQQVQMSNDRFEFQTLKLQILGSIPKWERVQQL